MILRLEGAEHTIWGVRFA